MIRSYITHCPYCAYKSSYYASYSTHIERAHPGLPSCQPNNITEHTTVETTRREDLGNTVDGDESSIPPVSGDVQIDTRFAGRIGAIGNDLVGMDDGHLVFEDQRIGQDRLSARRSTTEVFRDAGQPVGDGVRPDLPTEKTDPWFPFVSSYDFHL